MCQYDGTRYTVLYDVYGGQKYDVLPISTTFSVSFYGYCKF